MSRSGPSMAYQWHYNAGSHVVAALLLSTTSAAMYGAKVHHRHLTTTPLTFRTAYAGWRYQSTRYG
jgi:hypothetical protein